MAYIEINPDDAKELGIGASDIVEVYNDYGSTYAMAYPDGECEARSDLHGFRRTSTASRAT